MKNIHFYILSLLVLTSCNSSISIFNEELKGNGNIISKNIDVDKIIAIENNGIFNVIINQDSTQVIKIETDENILPYIKHEVKQNKIIFTFDESAKNKNLRPTKANIYITAEQITSLENNGFGNIIIENLNFKDDLNIQNSGVGHIKAANIEGNSLIITNSGVGNVNLKGKLNSLKIVNDGVGSVDTDEIPANMVEVENSGVGNVKVFAVKEISIENSGVGSVKYKGNPTVKKIDSSGLGKVKRVDK